MSVVVILLLVSPISARQTLSLRGTWTASSGSARAFRGTWSADVRQETPDAASGSWTLLDASNRIIVQGTWSAQKNARGWQGSWSATVASRPAGRSTSGPSISGSWKADMESEGAGTILEMLQLTVKRSVGGSWRSGRLGGQWALKALPR